MHREPRAEDHVGQRHRTRKALLGEQALCGNTMPRPPRLIGATLDDNLSPISEPNSNNLRHVPNDEQNLHRPRSQKSSTPPINPRRKVMHHQVTPGSLRSTTFAATHSPGRTSCYLARVAAPSRPGLLPCLTTTEGLYGAPWLRRCQSAADPPRAGAAETGQNVSALVRGLRLKSGRGLGKSPQSPLSLALVCR
jgi:hypothetical protein